MFLRTQVVKFQVPVGIGVDLRVRITMEMMLLVTLVGKFSHVY